MALNINSNHSNIVHTKKNNMAKLTATVLGSSDSSLLGAPDMSSLTKTVLGQNGGGSMLSDYAAIKDGSYGKLLKAYYAEKNSDSKAENTDKEDSKSDKSDTSSSVVDTYV